jgi:hypothetical protein
MKPILQKEKRYTFADYFDLAYPTEDVVAEFGYRKRKCCRRNYAQHGSRNRQGRKNGCRVGQQRG